MDSGFCVLEALIALREVGVYGSALIKKRRFWPKYIMGDEIIQHFNNKEVGEVDAIKGMKNGKSFFIHAMKEPDYTMMLMSTYGLLNEEETGGTKRSYLHPVTREITTKSFKYTTPFFNHFKFCHQVVDHNNRRHSPISIEEVVACKRWPLRQFFFLLALTEVNTKLGINRIDTDEHRISMLSFRKKLAAALINNFWYENEKKAEQLEEGPSPTSRRRRATALHEIRTRPPYRGVYDEKKENF